MHGWTCPDCGLPFARPLGGEWKHALRQQADAEIFGGDSVDLHPELTLALSGNAMVVEIRGDHHENGSDLDLESWVDSVWLRWHAWEQCSAIVDSMFGDHRDCVAVEWHAGQIDYGITSYVCPLGAAMAQTLAWLGGQHERSGGWPTSKAYGDTGFATFVQQVRRSPRWLIPVLAREVTKEWLSDAIRKFSASSSGPLSKCAWRPPERLELNWNIHGSTARINVCNNVVKISEDVVAAGLLCDEAVRQRKALGFGRSEFGVVASERGAVLNGGVPGGS
ncbi:hypothetical protein [Pelomonas sp. KK5]|uniref:hypothetical protein n=1 Tax=Pelomonas sp. KK5 TaxID=1855730 RepID=UPI00117DDCEE|nr:hypothetical protein [Pelomonas sp. KK5]